MSNTKLGGVCKLRNYRLERQHIFQSEGALTWFVRQNRTRLVEAGALVLLSGSWHAKVEVFDALVLQLGQEAALRHSQGGADRAPSDVRSI